MNIIKIIIKEELEKPKKGDKLMSTKNIHNSRTEGKVYTVMDVKRNPSYDVDDYITFINDSGVVISLPINDTKYQKSYRDSFIPFDYDETQDIFNQLD